MIRTARRLLSCHFTARRLNRYLDADPAAPLTRAEVQRLEAHLAECERCTGAVADLRAVRGALKGLAQRVGPKPEAVARIGSLVDDLADGQTR